jgi:hypothetical protein
LIHRDNDIHFPGGEIPDYKLTNEVGLNAANQSIHWQVNIARLLNRYPFMVNQYRQASMLPDDKPIQSQKQGNLPSKNFFEFLNLNPQDELFEDVPDAIWIPKLSENTIPS